MRVLFYLGAYTGLRLKDCCLLKWNNIHLNEGIIRCIPQKTKRKQREVFIPIFEQLYPVLLQAQEWKNNEYILPSIAAHSEKRYQTIKTNVSKVFRDCGFKTTEKAESGHSVCVIGFHSFRTSLASLLAHNGLPPATLKKMIGDNLSTIEQHYLKTNEDDVKNGVGIALTNFKRSDSEKLRIIQEILFGKKKLTDSDKKIIDVIQASSNIPKNFSAG